MRANGRTVSVGNGKGYDVKGRLESYWDHVLRFICMIKRIYFLMESRRHKQGFKRKGRVLLIIFEITW